MAQKKRRKKKTARKKQKQREANIIIQGIVTIILSLVALFNLGFIGRLLVTCLKYLVGTSYFLLLIALIVVSLYQIFQGRYFKPPFDKKIFGLIFLYLGILLACSLHLEQYEHANMIKSTFLALKGGHADVGGGLIGAVIYQGLEFLVSRIGVYIISVLLVVAGIMLIFSVSINNIPYYLAKIGNFFKEAFNSLQDLVEEHSDSKRNRQIEVEEAIIPPVYDEVENNDFIEPLEPSIVEEPVVNEQKQEEVTEPMVFVNTDDEDYVLPPISLLKELPKIDQSNEKRSVEYKKQILKQTFDSFGVDATVEDYHVGPAITKFEIKLAVGVKVSKIINLADDIALALAAKDVRIEAPIPGKSLIGIEVPNQAVGMVSFREVMEAKPKQSHLLEVPLGKDISGEVIMADLARMPHLLIAGSTGSGKSVCINGIITSILMQAKPNEVKLMMIDPKMVELSVYNGIPHLLTPVVTNPRKASQALYKLVEEMERRYELFANMGVRNMAGYNEYVKKNTDENLTSLPYIVVIVDELADLMMVASKEVEDAITRLAQMARAAGIHMILATQRPSVDVITGLIKANVPSRIAFAVSSGTDSRTILDSHGAEKLLGRGDMLFIPIGENKPMRIQGAFISDGEVENVVNFITQQKGPDYQEDMTPNEEDLIVDDKGQTPARYEEAVELVKREQKASASMIQRRLHIGYNAAANIIEEMENRGIVGPANGSKPREVYLRPTEEENN